MAGQLIELAAHVWKPVLALIGTGAATFAGAMFKRKWVRSRDWLRKQAHRIERTHAEIPKIKLTIESLFRETHEQGAAIRVLLSNGHYATFVCDASGYNLDVNETYCHFLGATREALMGRGWENFVKVKERERYAREWVPAMSAAREYTSKLVFTHRDGTEIDTLVRTTKLFEEDEKTLRGYYGVIMPMHKEKGDQAET